MSEKFELNQINSEEPIIPGDIVEKNESHEKSKKKMLKLISRGDFIAAEFIRKEFNLNEDIYQMPESQEAGKKLILKLLDKLNKEDGYKFGTNLDLLEEIRLKTGLSEKIYFSLLKDGKTKPKARTAVLSILEELIRLGGNDIRDELYEIVLDAKTCRDDRVQIFGYLLDNDALRRVCHNFGMETARVIVKEGYSMGEAALLGKFLCDVLGDDKEYANFKSNFKKNGSDLIIPTLRAGGPKAVERIYKKGFSIEELKRFPHLVSSLIDKK
jgi:hypothetical protein